MQFRLRTLLIVLAVGPVVLAGAWWIREANRDLDDLWHNPARYAELEEYLIEKGKAERGSDGTLYLITDKD